MMAMLVPQAPEAMLPAAGVVVGSAPARADLPPQVGDRRNHGHWPSRSSMAVGAFAAVASALVGAGVGSRRRLPCRSLRSSPLVVSAEPSAAGKSCASVPPGFEGDATDPSLFVTTNVVMGDKKKEFMQAASKAVASCLSKPESYVAVCVQDGQDVIWGGSDAPCALCKVFSLGSINLANNKALTQELSSLLDEFSVPMNRIYVNFFDLPRENVGYNGATFAG